jgi:hypothetical protein
MSDPENFLTRWSRRKLEPEKQSDAKSSETVPDSRSASDSADLKSDPADFDPAAAPLHNAAAPDQPFDLSSLPSVESIGPQSDITAYLQPDVPSALRNAALRRAWVADPAIRDFKGLAEYDWDFNDPNGMAGFGPLGPQHDVKEMVARVFGKGSGDTAENPQAVATSGEQLFESSKESDPEQDGATITASGADAENAAADSISDGVQSRRENIASQQDGAESVSPVGKPRRHGGALPDEIPQS